MNDEKRVRPYGHRHAVPGQDERDILHNRDISSKDVFANSFLCAQFLRDCIDVPALKNVRPEDIEDVSERYHPYLGTEFESDSVKKIRILGIGGKEQGQNGEPSFLISLIEHKSLVDYDVSMQLLRYMMCIWTEYRREMEVKKRGSTGQKSFRYPMIIPIVYYEGKSKWTADLNLRDRIREIPGLGGWIPDFRYEVICVHDYSERQLLEQGDEMSLIMLINKIQDAADLERFLRIPSEELNRIIRHSPEHVVDVLVTVMESLCFKIRVSAEDRVKCVQKVRAREMGYLFENMERINVQEVQQKAEEQRRKLEQAMRRAEEEVRRAEEEAKRAEEEAKRAKEEAKRAKEEAEEEAKRAKEEAEEEAKRAKEEAKRAKEEAEEIRKTKERSEERLKKMEEELRMTEEKLRLAEEAIEHLEKNV